MTIQDMSEPIRNKAIRGVTWSAVEKFARQGLMTLFTILIARQLSPSDYGLVAMLNIFLAVAQLFVDSGFVEALIRKQDRTEVDFSTTFWFNIGIAFIIYAILYVLSPLIAYFYNEPLLEEILVWVSLVFVINSFRVVQQAKLSIALNFRCQTWITMIAISVSGGVGLWMAYNEFGVWTLVWQPLLQNFLNVLLLWISAGWMPSLTFSKKSFRELFGFGSKLLITRTLHTLYTNGSYLLVGKFYSPALTGLYSQSVQMTSFLPVSVSDVVARVAYPIECELQHDDDALQRIFYRFLRMNAFIVFPLMAGLAAMAEPVVRLLLTDKWMDAVPLMQILCFGWMWQPFSVATWQILNAKNRSDYYLKSEIIKKIIAFVILISSMFFGITMVCIGWVIYCVIDLYIITLYTKRLIPCISYKGEMRVLLPILLRSLLMGGIVYSLRYLIDSDLLLIVFGILSGFIVYAGISSLTKSEEIRWLIGMAREKVCRAKYRIEK